MDVDCLHEHVRMRVGVGALTKVAMGVRAPSRQD